MAELMPKERLQPSLLDRLTDEEPHKTVEPRSLRVLPMAKLREAVRRDLTWLFNTTNLAALQDLEDYPDVAHSVINFGIPELAGHLLSNTDVGELERTLRQAILDFEPRILRNSVKIRAVVDADRMDANTAIFEIEGELWGQPAPEHLILRTQLDLETGDVNVRERL